MQIGALIAFLSYLTQILLAVMMATFMVVLVPRAAVCAERIVEVLDTPSSVVRAEAPVTEVRDERAGSSCATSASTTPAPRHRS